MRLNLILIIFLAFETKYLLVRVIISDFFNYKFEAQSSIEDQIEQIEKGLFYCQYFEGEACYSLTERMKFYQAPGISITLIKDFKILRTKQYGVADQEIQNRVTDQTLFNIGSLSKGPASLTLLFLIQKKKTIKFQKSISVDKILSAGLFKAGTKMTSEHLIV